MDLHRFNAPEVIDWIAKNQTKNIYELALKSSPFEDIPMNLLVQQIQGKQIAKQKFPFLYENKNILFPPKINLEQTSSTATAKYKTTIIQGNEIVDITGGLGIDSIYFSEVFDKVYHIEQNYDLQKIAQHNFSILNKTNINSYNGNGIEFLEKKPHLKDILFIDPARRDAQQKKVFLLEDLSPNILDYIHNWTNRFNEIWIKLSPMIDLKYLIQTIPNLSHIYLIAVKNELKEVLIQVKENKGKQITATNLQTNEPEFTVAWDTNLPVLTYSEIQNYIYEPNVAVQKSGYNDLLTKLYPIKKLHPNSQLFTSEELIKNFPGRTFKFKKLIKNPKKELKGLSVQAVHRNFPTTLTQLKNKYKFTTDGVRPFIFTQTQKNVLIIETEIMH